MIVYRFGTNEDNQRLIELTEATGMDGETGLRIDRKPDFYSLLSRRGESKVFVAEDSKVIVGAICVSQHLVYVGGQVFPVLYIGDFKVLPTYRNKGIGIQLCNRMADYVISRDADLAVLNVSQGNNKPLSFFKNRTGIPDFDPIGIFRVYQFVGKKRRNISRYNIVEVYTFSDSLLSFLDNHYQAYELGSVITKEKLNGSRVFIVIDDLEIVAAMCLTDLMEAKQNIITKLPWKLKIALKAMNLFGSIVGLSKMPELNKPVQMMYIKYLAVKNGNKNLIRALIYHARDIVYKKGYSFVSIGLHEKDPLCRHFSGLLKFTFQSVGMLLSIKDNKALIKQIKSGILFEDYSLV